MDGIRTVKVGKKWAACLICMLLVLGTLTATAATWQQGTSPSQPYLGRPAADLTKSLGYYMIYPRVKAPAYQYCDNLVIYLPREDVTVGTGKLYLYNGNGELVETVDCAESGRVVIEPMSEAELTSLMWGGGVAVRFKLLTSLIYNQRYYVEMEIGCIMTPQNRTNAAIEGTEKWQPVLAGDFGISGRYFKQNEDIDLAMVGPGFQQEETGEIEEDEEEDLIIADETEVANDNGLKLAPEKGDTVDFDLFFGGDAVTAVVYCPANTFYFQQIEYTAADINPLTGMAHVHGKQMADEPGDLGVFFLNGNGKVIRIVMITGNSPVGK